MASGTRPVFDFSLRRTQWPDVSLQVAKASYITGCSGTSNVLAGKLFGIKVMGTMAHSFVMSFDREIESFRAYAKIFPNQVVLLLDTYNYQEGIQNAIKIGQELKVKGFKLFGVRLDSGDLIKESMKIRTLLDKKGLSYVKIIASGNLDEYKIDKLIKAKAPIDSFGVGTNMGVSSDASYCDIVYKISEIKNAETEFSPIMKLSSNKATYPGRKQIYRLRDKRGNLSKDIIALEGERQSGEPLLKKMIEREKTLYEQPLLGQVRSFLKRQLSELPSTYKKLKCKKVYPVINSSSLKKLTREISKKIREIKD